MVDFERRYIPTFGLEEVVLDETTKQRVATILNTGWIYGGRRKGERE